MTAFVSATQEPAPVSYVDHWERGLDPWHPDAFKGTVLDGAFREPIPPRQAGWYAIDWCGNVIGFVPDGLPVEIDANAG
jgi:hypothetical protein